MNGFVLCFAMPCLLYRFDASTPVGKLLGPGTFTVNTICALFMVGAAVALTLSERIDWNNAALRWR